MNLSFKEIILAGGPVLFFLIALSVYSIAIMWERWVFYRKNLSGLLDFSKGVKRLIKMGEIKRALDACSSAKIVAAAIFENIISSSGNSSQKREYANQAIEWYTTAFHKRLASLATIGSTAPFIGLFGTVLGVMRAFKDLSNFAGAGPSVVAAGIAEALVNTAAGLFVAIPAIVAYNYFISRANQFIKNMEWSCEEIIGLMQENPLPSEPNIDEVDATSVKRLRK